MESLLDLETARGYSSLRHTTRISTEAIDLQVTQKRPTSLSHITSVSSRISTVRGRARLSLLPATRPPCSLRDERKIGALKSMPYSCEIPSYHLGESKGSLSPQCHICSSASNAFPVCHLQRYFQSSINNVISEGGGEGTNSPVSNPSLISSFLIIDDVRFAVLRHQRHFQSGTAATTIHPA